ncbi:MAG: voltage-gated potassium channel [bacterium]|jgi:voltage-gated potassium channel
MYRVLTYFWRKRHLYLKVESNTTKVVVLSLGLFWYASSGFLFFELPAKPDLTWEDSFWWALVTMTTVGYGDYFPESFGGRYLIGIPTMIFGIGLLGFIISDVAAKLVESRSRRIQGMVRIKSENHILIINFSRIEKILDLIREIQIDSSTEHKEICLIDEHLLKLPNELLQLGVHFVKGNPANENVLLNANIAKASHAIILVKEDQEGAYTDERNLATTLVIESINPEIFSIAEVNDSQKIRQFKMAGCDSTVCVSDLVTNLITQELQDPGLKLVLKELTSNQYGQQLYLAPIKKMEKWSYSELVLWGLDSGYSVLGLLRDGSSLLNCSANTKIQNTDKVIVIGKGRVNSITSS